MIKPLLEVNSLFTHFFTEEGVDRAVEAVMYMGKMVEIAHGEDLFHRPLHPYTQVLLTAIPKLIPQKREEALVKEEHRPIPSEGGCIFQSRCPHPRERCQIEEPLLLDEGEDHFVACHFAS